MYGDESWEVLAWTRSGTDGSRTSWMMRVFDGASIIRLDRRSSFELHHMGDAYGFYLKRVPPEGCHPTTLCHASLVRSKPSWVTTNFRRVVESFFGLLPPCYGGMAIRDGRVREPRKRKECYNSCSGTRVFEKLSRICLDASTFDLVSSSCTLQ